MKKKRYLIFVVFQLLYTLSASTQSIDSLRKALQNDRLTTEDSLSLLMLTSKAYASVNPDSALYFVKKGQHLINENLPVALKLEWWVNAGGIYLTNRMSNEAKEVLALAMAKEEIDELPKIKKKAMLNLAAVYLNLQIYDQSLELFKATLPLIQGEEVLEIKAHNNIGILYSRLGDYEKALVNFKKALALNKLSDVAKLSTYINLAGLYAQRKEYEEAIDAYIEASNLAEHLNHFPAMAVLYSNLSNVYNETENYQKSLEFALKGLDLKEKHQLPGKIFALNNVGYAYFLLEQYDKAISYYQEALPIAKGKEELGLFLNLKNAYEKDGAFAKALHFFDLYTTLKDSLDALDYKTKVADIDAKYESEKKEYEINLLRFKNENQQAALGRKNQLIAGIIIVSLLLIGFIYLFQHQLKIKQQFEKTVLRQRLLRMQLNPHFLFNALNGIQLYLHDNKPEKSIDYLSSFSKLMRFILDKSEEEWVSLAEEIEMLDHYLQLQQLNHNDGFTYKITVGEDIEPSDLMVPALVTQPILENAVIHGLSGFSDGEISLSYKKDGDGLNVQVVDNGIGHDSKKDNANRMHNSMGTTIIINRLTMLKKKFKSKIGLNISTAKSDEGDPRPGTLVNIQLPWVVRPI